MPRVCIGFYSGGAFCGIMPDEILKQIGGNIHQILKMHLVNFEISNSWNV